MVFNSAAFLIFIAVFFSLYALTPARARLLLILLASYVFYGWWDWRYLSLIILSTAVDYTAGRMIGRTEAPGQRKAWLTASVIVNLVILVTFKYFNFFAASAARLLAACGLHADAVTLNVLLPVGISFYTFQSMAYTIDVYRGKIPAERGVIPFAAFVSFFPQLVAGPIERAASLLPQLKALKGPTGLQIRQGAFLVVWGYFQKVFIADNLSRFIDVYFALGRKQAAFLAVNPPDPFILDDALFAPIISRMGLHLTAPEILLCLTAFSLQIYADFAGYSNIARGIAKFFGVELMVNFRQPYFARNPSEFWQRWHISLSSWFREYLYIPLGGSRGGIARTLRNLTLTMFLAGLWHGAAWHFALWGLYQGLLLAGYHGLKARIFWGQWNGRAAQGMAVLMMYLLTLYGWLIFRAENLSQLWYFTVQLFTRFSWPPVQARPEFQVQLFWTAVFTGIVLLADTLLERRNTDCLWTFHRRRDFAFTAGLVFLILIFGGQSESFIYFRF